MDEQTAKEINRNVVEHINGNEESHKMQIDGLAECILIIARSLENDSISSIACSKALHSLSISILNEEEDYSELHKDPDKFFELNKKYVLEKHKENLVDEAKDILNENNE